MNGLSFETTQKCTCLGCHGDCHETPLFAMLFPPNTYIMTLNEEANGQWTTVGTHFLIEVRFCCNEYLSIMFHSLVSTRVHTNQAINHVFFTF